MWTTKNNIKHFSVIQITAFNNDITNILHDMAQNLLEI